MTMDAASLARNKRVSIVIAAYNCARTLPATLDSCLAQTHSDTEIVVVDDGSTDDTAAVLASYGTRIRVISQPNGGLASARNTGMRAARGEYLAWMDADDLMASGRVLLQAAVLASDDAIELVCSDFSAFVEPECDYDPSHISRYYSAVTRLGGLTNIFPQSREIAADGTTATVRAGAVYLALLSGSFVHPPTVMVRRTLFERAGYFDESLRYNSDFDFILRASRLGRYAYVDAPLLRYRRSDTQMSHSAAGGRIPLETVRILEKVRQEDPETYTRQEKLMRHRMAELLIDAADVIGPADRRRALGLLRDGLRHQVLMGAAAHALARIVVPRTAVAVVKSGWRFLLLGGE